MNTVPNRDVDFVLIGKKKHKNKSGLVLFLKNSNKKINHAFIYFLSKFFINYYADSASTCFIMRYTALVDQNEPQSEYGTRWRVKKKYFTQAINQ